MAVILGYTGTVQTWPTGINAYLAATGQEPAELQIEIEADELDTTTFVGSTGQKAHIPGLRNWRVTWRSYLKAISHGTNGLVTYTGSPAGGYVTNLNAFRVEVVRPALDVTTFGSSTYRTFFPGLIEWGGEYSGFQDDTADISQPGDLALEPATIRLKYQEVSVTDDGWLTGSAFTTRTNPSSKPSEVNPVSYTFRGTGDLTQQAPTSGVGVFPTGAIAQTALDTLTVLTHTGQTFAGSAFWSNVTINCRVGELVEVNVTAQGSGALTIT